MFEYLLKGHLRKLVLQGQHERRVIDFFKKLIRAWVHEFREDNRPTTDHHLKELFDRALDEFWAEEKAKIDVQMAEANLKRVREEVSA